MVDSVGRNQAHNAYRAQAGKTNGTQPSGSDRQTQKADAKPPVAEAAVYISQGTRTIQRALEMVKDSPDVRAERVAELRWQVKAGVYEVPTDKLAAKMLGRSDAQE